MRPSVQRDFDWQRQFIPQVQALLGKSLFREATLEEDQAEATDIVLVTPERSRIAVRLRNADKYWPRYREEFTMRESRPSGAVTELEKIRKGWGDLFFYGFADPASERIIAWWLYDLEVFRQWTTGHPLGISQVNSDGTTFRVFKREDFPLGFVVAANEAQRWAA